MSGKMVMKDGKEMQMQEGQTLMLDGKMTEVARAWASSFSRVVGSRRLPTFWQLAELSMAPRRQFARHPGPPVRSRTEDDWNQHSKPLNRMRFISVSAVLGPLAGLPYSKLPVLPTSVSPLVTYQQGAWVRDPNRLTSNTHFPFSSLPGPVRASTVHRQMPMRWTVCLLTMLLSGLPWCIAI